jgi:hypothetical protein
VKSNVDPYFWRSVCNGDVSEAKRGSLAASASPGAAEPFRPRRDEPDRVLSRDHHALRPTTTKSARRPSASFILEGKLKAKKVGRQIRIKRG